ncbi:MAG: DUF2442 domain-containing protein [bacterium]|nr:DUF2442 domain-containing protein [bacterium]
MHFVTDVTYVDDYRLKVQFDNSEHKLVDLGPHLDGSIFEPLKDLAFFKTVRLNPDIDTVVWPNDADFSPDFLHEIGVPSGDQATESREKRTVRGCATEAKAGRCENPGCTS